MNQQKEKLVIAFYGKDFGNIPLRDAISAWWRWTEEACRDLGITLTHIDAKFKEKPSGLSDHKPYGIDRYGAIMGEQLARDNVEQIILNSLNDPSDYIAFDWTVTSSCGYDPRFGGISLIGVECEALSKWGKSTLIRFLEKCLEAANCLRIVYGFGVIMPKEYFPSGYLIGVTARNVDARILLDTTAWRRFARQNCEKKIRNVYGWNIITSSHLRLDIGGQTLKEWIEDNKDRGELKIINPTLYCWSFENRTESTEFLGWDFSPVDSLRQELENHRFFPWQEIER